MSIKLTEELLHLESFVGQNTGQVVAEGTLVLPSSKPACAEVIKVVGKPLCDGVQVEEDRVVVEGLLGVTVVYLSAAEEDAEGQYDGATWERVLPFSYLFDVPGAMPGMKAEVELEIGEMTLDPSGDGRSFAADCVIEGFARVTETKECWVVTDAMSTTSRKLDVEAENVRLEEVLTDVESQFNVSGTVAFSNTIPAIEQMLYVTGEAQVTSARYQVDRLSLSGHVTCEILYRPEGSNTVATARWADALTFEEVFDAPGAVPGVTPQIDLKVVSFSARPVVGGTGLELQAQVKAKAKGVETRTLPLVLSIEGDKNGPEIVSRKESIRLEQRVGSSSKALTSQFTVEVPESKPPVDTIISFGASAKAADIKVQGNRVTVAGFLDVEMLYEGHVDLDEPPIYSARWGNAATFEAAVDVPGAETGMDVQVEVEVLDQVPDLINRETCEVSVDVKVSVKVTETLDQELVAEAVETKQVTGRAPSYVCVRVQPDDTLWKIAARYGSSVDKLIDYNPELKEISDRDLLPIGARVFIPRETKAPLQEVQ